MCICTKYVGDRMPRFDGTGPRGLGPMTGGGRGFCTGYFPTSYLYYAPRSYPNYGFPASYSLSYPRYMYPYMTYPRNGIFRTVPPTTVPPTTPPTVSPYVGTPFGATFPPTYSEEQERQMLLLSKAGFQRSEK